MSILYNIYIYIGIVGIFFGFKTSEKTEQMLKWRRFKTKLLGAYAY